MEPSFHHRCDSCDLRQTQKTSVLPSVHTCQRWKPSMDDLESSDRLAYLFSKYEDRGQREDSSKSDITFSLWLVSSTVDRGRTQRTSYCHSFTFPMIRRSSFSCPFLVVAIDWTVATPFGSRTFPPWRLSVRWKGCLGLSKSRTFMGYHLSFLHVLTFVHPGVPRRVEYVGSQVVGSCECLLVPK